MSRNREGGGRFGRIESFLSPMAARTDL